MPVTIFRRLTLAAVAVGTAAVLAGCAARPLSLEEKIWFDRAINYDLARHPSPAFSAPQYDPYGAPRYPR